MSEFIKIKATASSISRRKLVFGVGVNDASYVVRPTVGNTTIFCPYYKKWSLMLQRCYDHNSRSSLPSYIGCSVADEWLTFSNFKNWMAAQDWEGKELDKDIIVAGNKIYSPSTCAFVSKSLNRLMSDCIHENEGGSKGFCFDKNRGLYSTQCHVNGKRKFLGRFKTASEAECVYLRFKSDAIKIAAENETGAVKESLINYSLTLLKKSESLELSE